MVNAISDQAATVGTVFNYTVPANTFNDADSDTLTYAATLNGGNELPSWLSFTAATRAFSGTPATANVGTLEVTVTASDGTDSVGDTFDIVVSAAPVVPTGQLFVDNTGEANAFAANVRTDDTTSQSFTTGPNTGGYILTSIGVVANLSASGDTFSLAVHTADTDGAPVALHADMIAPANFPAGETTVTFTAPPNTMLAADTPYAIVLGLVGATRNIRTTRSDADNAGTSGWSIGNNHHFYSASAMAWRSSGNPRAAKIAIRGTAVGGGTNTAPMGAPTITGTAQVGETLTAVTTGITDADGLTSPTYTYQWIRVDGAEADISGANSNTYTLDAADLGKTIKVKVSFTDDASNTETLTSAATATVTAATTTLGSAALVSNLNQPATSALAFVHLTTEYALAQGFTTGENPGDYTLTSIEVAFNAGLTAVQLGNLTAGVWSDDGSDNPDTELFTLTKPASIGAATAVGSDPATVTGNYTVFNAPAGRTLVASTPYHVVPGGGHL